MKNKRYLMLIATLISHYSFAGKPNSPLSPKISTPPSPRVLQNRACMQVIGLFQGQEETEKAAITWKNQGYPTLEEAQHTLKTLIALRKYRNISITPALFEQVTKGASLERLRENIQFHSDQLCMKIIRLFQGQEETEKVAITWKNQGCPTLEEAQHTLKTLKAWQKEYPNVSITPALFEQVTKGASLEQLKENIQSSSNQ